MLNCFDTERSKGKDKGKGKGKGKGKTAININECHFPQLAAFRNAADGMAAEIFEVDELHEGCRGLCIGHLVEILEFMLRVAGTPTDKEL